MGLVGNYALIDEGTSQIRTLFIYDAIINDKLIFKDAYVGGLKMEDGFLLFDQQIDAEFVDPKPACPEEYKEMEDNIGYIGVYKYDFKAKGTSFTGEFRCQYFE